MSIADRPYTAPARAVTAVGLPRRLFTESPSLPFALVAVAVFLALAASEAGFYPAGSAAHQGLGWYPASLILLALLAGAAIALRIPTALTWPTKALLGLLGLYVLWAFLSITWAEQQGVAWDGANRAATYLIVVALFTLWPLRPPAAHLLLGAFGLGIAAIGLIELLRADASPQPLRFFIDARLSEPAGYINANVALWSIGLLPCVWLAAARRTPVILRGLFLGGAGVLAALALMGQSRGWALAMPFGAIALLALTPGRVRLGLAGLVVAGGTLAVKGTVLAIHDSFDVAGFDALVSEATGAILAMSAVLSIVGLLAALADRLVSPSEGQARGVSIGAAVLTVVALAAGAVVFVALEGNPVSKVSDSWESFKRGGGEPQAGGSRFSSVGTNRYDFWRVALDRFAEQPIHGIGAENFQQDYLARGRSPEQPRYPHSLELGVLAQTGLVGALALTGALLAGLLAALLPRSGVPREARAAAGAALALFAYWLAHASIDWFWEFPGLTAPALAALGLAGATVRAPSAQLAAQPARHSGVLRAAALGAAALGALALTVSLVAPWLAERETVRATELGPRNSSAALRRLERARKLNPLAARPRLIAAVIALRTDDEQRAARELAAVLRREPRTAYALAQLGALASEAGERRRASDLFTRASRAAPRNAVITDAARRARGGAAVETRQLSASFARAAASRVRLPDQ